MASRRKYRVDSTQRSKSYKSQRDSSTMTTARHDDLSMAPLNFLLGDVDAQLSAFLSTGSLEPPCEQAKGSAGEHDCESRRSSSASCASTASVRNEGSSTLSMCEDEVARLGDRFQGALDARHCGLCKRQTGRTTRARCQQAARLRGTQGLLSRGDDGSTIIEQRIRAAEVLCGLLA